MNGPFRRRRGNFKERQALQATLTAKAGRNDFSAVPIADAEAYLIRQGFKLMPNSCDWRNATGDDAGCYPVEREPYGTVEGFRVEINRSP